MRAFKPGWGGLTVLILVCALLPAPARASFHYFQIREVYSNPSGTIQFIELTESIGADFENFWQGVTISSNTKSFTFPANLPDTDTSNRSVLLATHEFSHLSTTPLVDFEIPDNFLSPAGDTLNFGFADIVTFGAMPPNPLQSLNRSGGSFVAATAEPTNFSGTSGIVPEPGVAAAIVGSILILARRRRHA
jgi:serralysin